MTGRTVRLGGLFALACLLSACSGGRGPTDAYYRIELPAPARLEAPALPGVVEVSRFGAEGLTGDRAFLYSYRDKPEQVLHYDYRFWTEAPPLLLQDQLVGYLRRAGAAARVVTADLRVPPEYVIQGRIRRFEQLVGPPNAVAVTLDLAVVRLHGNELMLLRTYSAEKAASEERAADAVAAFQAALGEIFAQFVADLGQAAASR